MSRRCARTEGDIELQTFSLLPPSFPFCLIFCESGKAPILYSNQIHLTYAHTQAILQANASQPIEPQWSFCFADL
jgi:hypothetical protein